MIDTNQQVLYLKINKCADGYIQKDENTNTKQNRLTQEQFASRERLISYCPMHTKLRFYILVAELGELEAF